MLNHKNLQKNLGRTGGAANSKIVGTSSWTIAARWQRLLATVERVSLSGQWLWTRRLEGPSSKWQDFTTCSLAS